MKLEEVIDLSEMCSKCGTMEIVHDEKLWMQIGCWLRELRNLREDIMLLGDAFPAGEYNLNSRQFIELNNMMDWAVRIRDTIVNERESNAET